MSFVSCEDLRIGSYIGNIRTAVRILAVRRRSRTSMKPETTTLTIARARSIVEHVEYEYAADKGFDYSFTPFEAGGASSPLEALQAFYIVIAEFFQFSRTRQSGSSAAMKGFDDYVASSRSIAMRLAIESTKIHSIAERLSPDMIASLLAFETVESFVSFLGTLQPASADYWPQVYQRIGLAYPVEPRPSQVEGADKKAWWRFW